MNELFDTPVEDTTEFESLSVPPLNPTIVDTVLYATEHPGDTFWATGYYSGQPVVQMNGISDLGTIELFNADGERVVPRPAIEPLSPKEEEIASLKSMLEETQGEAIAALDGFLSRDASAELRMKRQGWRHRLRELELGSELEAMRADKLAELAVASNENIRAGIDVGGYHYPLEVVDKFKLQTQLAAIKTMGAEKVLFKAEGELCRMFTADEFVPVANAAIAHVTKHETYLSHLNEWANDAETIDELDKIFYGADLPDELKRNMDELLEEAAGGQSL